MSNTQIREELHNYINRIDDQSLSVFYSMMKQHEGEELSASEKQMIDERLSFLEKNPDSVVSWSEFKARLTK